MILFVKHVEIEGPETIGKFFKKKGFLIKTCELYRGGQFPKNFDELEAVIILGGPMNVYEEDLYLWLKEENLFIQQVLKRKIPYLGICLGSQLLAKASGAKVGESPKKEIGFSPVSLTEKGRRDPLFEGVVRNFDVYQWHGDMFQIPQQGILLASSKSCPHQAFNVGEYAYGLQFHIEITDRSIKDWSDSEIKQGNVSFKRAKDKMLKDYDEKKIIFHQTAEKIYNNFLSLIKERKKTYANSPGAN